MKANADLTDLIRFRCLKSLKNRAKVVAEHLAKQRGGCDLSDVAREGLCAFLEVEEVRLGIKPAPEKSSV